jgi:hypothetical protein
MRPNSTGTALVLSLLLLAPLAAQEAPSPRQSYQRTEALFAQGHTFTAEEETSLNDLRAKLVDSGDTDLAASLDLLRLGAATSAQVEASRAQAASSLEADAQGWAERERRVQDAGLWKAVRDGGLILFTASTATSLLLAVINDRNDGYLKNGQYSDWVAKQSFSNGMNWALLGSVSTMFVSLFPLLWGEARQ